VEDTPDFDDPPSKSQRKRDMNALQDIGAELLELNDQQLAGIELPENLHAAVTEARKLRANGARRRQLQYIGKLMRQVDPAPIREKLDGFRSTSAAETARLHRIRGSGGGGRVHRRPSRHRQPAAAHADPQHRRGARARQAAETFPRTVPDDPRGDRRPFARRRSGSLKL